MAHIAVWQLEYQVIYLFVGLSGREQDTVAWDLYFEETILKCYKLYIYTQ